MIRDFNAMFSALENSPKQTVVVAAAEDDTVLEAVNSACCKGLVHAILVGN